MQNHKVLSNRLFSLLAILGAFWTFTDYMMSVSVSIDWFLRSYAFGILVISTGLIWTMVITDKYLNKKKVITIIIFALIFFFASIQHNFIIDSTNQIHPGTIFIGNTGPGLILYTTYYLFFSFTIIWKLYKTQKNTNNLEEKNQLKYVLIGALITLITSAFTSFVTPLSSVILSQALDSIGFLIFLLFVAYSITRHNLFNIKVITIEVITVSLWFTILMRTLLAKTLQEKLIEGGILALTLLFGIILINSTLHEFTQRRRIEELTAKLQESYDSIKKLEEKNKG